MTRTNVAILSAVAFASGVGVGAWWTSSTMMPLYRELAPVPSTVIVALAVQTLHELRAQNVSVATELLERRLDAEVLNLDSLGWPQLPATTANALRVAREYRNKFPWQSGDAANDDAVKRALNVVARGST